MSGRHVSGEAPALFEQGAVDVSSSPYKSTSIPACIPQCSVGNYQAVKSHYSSNHVPGDESCKLSSHPAPVTSSSLSFNQAEENLPLSISMPVSVEAQPVPLQLSSTSAVVSVGQNNFYNGDAENSANYNSLLQSTAEVTVGYSMLKSVELIPPSSIPSAEERSITDTHVESIVTEAVQPPPVQENVVTVPKPIQSLSLTSDVNRTQHNPLFSSYEVDPENVVKLLPASDRSVIASHSSESLPTHANSAKDPDVAPDSNSSLEVQRTLSESLPSIDQVRSDVGLSPGLTHPAICSKTFGISTIATSHVNAHLANNTAEYLIPGSMENPSTIMSTKLSSQLGADLPVEVVHAPKLTYCNTLPSLEASTSMEIPEQLLCRPSLCYTRVLLGEITPLLAVMRRATPRWSQHQTDISQDPLVVKLRELQVHISSLSTQPGAAPPSPAVFLEPFLAVIRSDDTTGPVTKTALASVNRMLSYGLLSTSSPGAAAAVEDIATTVTHARFVGTDQGADEVVLWEILSVLKTLLLGPVGHLLTNESVCELLNSSFRICFETRLSELLRNCTEDALRQMVNLLFARLPQFADDPHSSNARRIRMKAGGSADNGKTGKKSKASKLLQRSNSNSSTQRVKQARPGAVDLKYRSSLSLNTDSTVASAISEPKDAGGSSQHSGGSDPDTNAEKCMSPSAVVPSGSPDSASIDSGITDPSLGIADSSSLAPACVDISDAHLQQQGSLDDLQSPISDTSPSALPSSSVEDVSLIATISASAISSTADISSGHPSPDLPPHKPEILVNTQGVKFTPADAYDGELVPYGMACVREVLRFLITLTNPTNEQNTPNMIATALGLITVALEVGGEHVNKCSSLLRLVRDQLCRNLLLLLKPEVRPSILMASLRVCILIFESLRTHVKFQLEMFMIKLMDIITSEATNVSYAHKELALETVVQLWRIPGLITELFVNFDCDLYSDNTFEDLTKILSKNAFPVQGLYSTNILSLDALLAVIDTLDSHSLSQLRDRDDISKKSIIKDERIFGKCAGNVVGPPASGYLLGIGLLNGFSPVTPELIPFTVLKDDEELSREHLLALKEKKKLLATGTDQFNVKPEKGIQFLQDNGILGTTNEDIAVFMKENPKLDKKMIGEYLSKKKNVGILSAFVKSFEFKGLRIDQCLRTFLETFRLPGEAPLISIIIEHFSEHWHKSNNEPFGKEDAAFTLAYAVIMLNVDQHNQNAKKQNIPMTLDQFRNNLRGVNDGKDFDPAMLEEVYNAICSEEIIMPAEQTGLVKENYIWKMMLKRGGTKEGIYMLANDDHSFDRDLFGICWGPTVASLSYVFDKSTDDAFVQKSLTGFKKCASIAARYGMSDVFDNLVVSLCKFTSLTSSAGPADAIAIEFGSNAKAQLAAKTLFRLVTLHGDILRDGWKNVVEVLLQLFRCRLLPSDLTESPDLLEGCASLYRPTNLAQPRVESSLLSSLYSFIALGDGGSRGSSPEDEECRDRAKKCIVDCHIEKLIRESAFLRHDSLSDMLKAIMLLGDGSCLVASSRSDVVSGVSDGFGGEGEALDEYGHALLLEIVVQIIIANKDRAGVVWTRVHDYILSLMKTCATGYTRQPQPGGETRPPQQSGGVSGESVWLLCRCVAALLRLAAVLVRRPDMSSVALQSLRMLFLLTPSALTAVSLQIVAGVHEVLTLTADHITRGEDWAVVFALMEWAGAGTRPPVHMLPPRLSQHLLNMRSLPESEVGSSSGPDSGHCSEVGSGAEATGGGPPAAPLKPSTEGAGSRATSPEVSGTSPSGWIMVGPEDGEVGPGCGTVPSSAPISEWDIALHREFIAGHPVADAVVRSVDTLVFLVRERHMTRSSLPHAVHCARTFVEATLHGGRAELHHQQQQQQQRLRGDGGKSPRRRLGGRKRGDDHKSGGSGGKKSGGTRSRGAPGGGASNAYDADESDSDDLPATYQQLSEKLLDLLDTLHTSAGSVMAKPPSSEGMSGLNDDQDGTEVASLPADNSDQNSTMNSGSISAAPQLLNNSSSAHNQEVNSTELSVQTQDTRTTPLDFSSRSVLWQEVLCPLLQGIARYCCDNRSRVRHMALTYLQRALLNHDLQTLDAAQWEACFNKVLFPLLGALLPPANSPTMPAAASGNVEASPGTEESRLRAATLVQKVYLRHLTTLLTLPTFTALWLTILDFLDKYLHINTTDHLCDAVPEILKNMLLVMETTHVFHTAQGFTRLWSVTWDRVDSFLPGFRTELFKSHPPSKIHRVDMASDTTISEDLSTDQHPSAAVGAPSIEAAARSPTKSVPPANPLFSTASSFTPVYLEAASTSYPAAGTVATAALTTPATTTDVFHSGGDSSALPSTFALTQQSLTFSAVHANDASTFGSSSVYPAPHLSEQPRAIDNTAYYSSEAPARLPDLRLSTPLYSIPSLPIVPGQSGPSLPSASMSDDEATLGRQHHPTPIEDLAAHRLSLSEECLPSFTSKIVLHPPLPASTHNFPQTTPPSSKCPPSTVSMITSFPSSSLHFSGHVDGPETSTSSQLSNKMQSEAIVTPPSALAPLCASQPLTASHLFRPKAEGEDPFQSLTATMPHSGI
ncbi:Sec7 domain [Trinorchestia longiramus]|nr:Sec7 domain [Trinorchestia longiramus]